MENGERIKREAPKRQNPDRGFANMFGQPVGGDTNGSSSTSDNVWSENCLLYTSDAADEYQRV